eukprot:CAMPEP_0168626764 /NCGR_PEP_ID=MMETSP0449_2-20121227/10824_1 /TAXON_ID=1082188 /ORGANISM="Strombidium rassoulzadegani, Strain ras09" /LENGTH=299 /DNA_ID=CAMNT_0008668817 /DNA_START=133 /DNA_END=1031 /DNA_ORIENTATION=-
MTKQVPSNKKKRETDSEKVQEEDNEKDKQTDDKEEKKGKGEEEGEEQEQDQAEFKTYRRLIFLMGKAIKYTSWAALALLGYHLAIVRKYKKPEEEAPFVIGPFMEAAGACDFFIKDMKILFTMPGMTKMLPDRMNMPGYMNPKTLVINLNGTLVHQEYKLGVGSEIFKRPGLSTFIQRMSRNYEVVVFGMGESGSINEICMALDPNGQMIVGRFGRENTVLKNGKYIKDLTYLNRPLKEIVYVDYSDDAVEFHKANCILIPKFDGDSGDRDLIDLIPFLEYLARSPNDVRSEIIKHGGN